MRLPSTREKLIEVALVYLITIFENNFLFFKIKKEENSFFVLKKIKNKVFSYNIF